MIHCTLGDHPIEDPATAAIYTRVTGWQTKGSGESRKSGSDIVLREQTGELACGTCINRLKSKIHTGQGSLDLVEERTEPLCSDCFAEVTWIRLARGEGKRMPVDREQVRGRDPRRGWVLCHATQDVGIVLRDSDLEAAKRRVEQGARLYRPHRASCRSGRLRAAA